MQGRDLEALVAASKLHSDRLTQLEAELAEARAAEEDVRQRYTTHIATVDPLKAKHAHHKARARLCLAPGTCETASVETRRCITALAPRVAPNCAEEHCKLSEKRAESIFPFFAVSAAAAAASLNVSLHMLALNIQHQLEISENGFEMISPGSKQCYLSRHSYLNTGTPSPAPARFLHLTRAANSLHRLSARAWATRCRGCGRSWTR